MPERVLIIDDEDNIRQMLRLALEAADYEVGEARDGMEAFAIIGGDSAWDVMLLDQRMPDLDGTEVLRRLKVLVPAAPVVMMSAFGSIELAVEAMKLGATDFIRKPMTPEVVRNAVIAAMNNVAQKQANSVTAVTMNGFTILEAGLDAGEVSTDSNERHFVVRRPDGTKQRVVVEISDEAFKSAEHLAPGVPIASSFWTAQAKTFLSDFIWTDGDVPATGRLVLKSAEQEHLEQLAQAKERDA